MTFMVLNLQTEDYDAWKPMFDSDPAGRKQAAKGTARLRERVLVGARSAPVQRVLEIAGLAEMFANGTEKG